MSPAPTQYHGPLGREGIHSWYPAKGGNVGGVEDSDPHVDMNVDGGPYGYYKIDRIGGFHSLPEAEDNRESLNGRMGERVYPSYPRGKTLTYEGRMMATNLDTLRYLSTNLRAKFGERSEEGRMVITANPSYGSVSHRFDARVMSLDMDEDFSVAGLTHPHSGYQLAYTIGLRMGDPRYYSSPNVGDTGFASGTSQNFYNHGSAPTEIQIITHGAIDGTLTMQRTNPGDTVTLKFIGLSFGDGADLLLSSRFRYLKGVDNGVDYTSHYDFDNSDWWDEGEVAAPVGPYTIHVSGCDTWDLVAFDAFY